MSCRRPLKGRHRSYLHSHTLATHNNAADLFPRTVRTPISCLGLLMADRHQTLSRFFFPDSSSVKMPHCHLISFAFFFFFCHCPFLNADAHFSYALNMGGSIVQSDGYSVQRLLRWYFISPGNIFTVVICNDLRRRWNQHVFRGSGSLRVCSQTRRPHRSF